MKNSPLVSVIIPAYNHELYIEEALQSVINQGGLTILDHPTCQSAFHYFGELVFLCLENLSSVR